MTVNQQPKSLKKPDAAGEESLKTPTKHKKIHSNRT